jgi:hypothetical protein
MFLKLFLNAMIRNVKIHNIFDVIEISKSMEPFIYIYMFPMIFQNSMGLGKSRCDVLSGTTQGWVCYLCLVMGMLTLVFILEHLLF